MKYVRITAGYTGTDYRTNTQIANELKITPILDKLLAYKRNLIQHVNRIPRNRLPKVMKHYCPTGRRNHGRPLKTLLDTWDWSGSTSYPTPWHDDDDDVQGHLCNVYMTICFICVFCLRYIYCSAWNWFFVLSHFFCHRICRMSHDIIDSGCEREVEYIAINVANNMYFWMFLNRLSCLPLRENRFPLYCASWK